MENYVKLGKAGEGAHGVVFKAEAKRRHEFEEPVEHGKRKHAREASETPEGGTKFVAIKKIRMKNSSEGLSIDAIREIKLLQELEHPNVMKVLDIFNHEQNINIVMPFMDTDLSDVVNSDVVISPADIKAYMKMIVQGVDYCHRNWVLHRDLKPGNILVGTDGVLKLADFGLAKLYGSPNRELSHQACTLWYRAPELLLGAKWYGTAADMWSVGCIFGELMLRKPMFAGDSEMNQLSVIFGNLGTPKDDDWPDMVSLPQYTKFTACQGIPMKQKFSAATDDALDLLEKMLLFDPQRRLTAAEVLQHRYFSSLPSPTEAAKLPVVTKKRH